jgi:hypothetical protein
MQDKQHVEEVVQQQACEIQALKNYEQQLSNMSRALSKMEETLRQEQEEKVWLVSGWYGNWCLCSSEFFCLLESSDFRPGGDQGTLCAVGQEQGLAQYSALHTHHAL